MQVPARPKAVLRREHLARDRLSKAGAMTMISWSPLSRISTAFAVVRTWQQVESHYCLARIFDSYDDLIQG
jgi:hypothetical protein